MFQWAICFTCALLATTASVLAGSSSRSASLSSGRNSRHSRPPSHIYYSPLPNLPPLAQLPRHPKHVMAAPTGQEATGYRFAFAVRDEPTSKDHSHQETSDGQVVRGSYRVALPDGRTQIVTYRADHNGYVADVSYEGNINYPDASSGGYVPSHHPLPPVIPPPSAPHKRIRPAAFNAVSSKANEGQHSTPDTPGTSFNAIEVSQPATESRDPVAVELEASTDATTPSDASEKASKSDVSDIRAAEPNKSEVIHATAVSDPPGLVPITQADIPFISEPQVPSVGFKPLELTPEPLPEALKILESNSTNVKAPELVQLPKGPIGITFPKLNFPRPGYVKSSHPKPVANKKEAITYPRPSYPKSLYPKPVMGLSSNYPKPAGSSSLNFLKPKIFPSSNNPKSFVASPSNNSNAANHSSANHHKPTATVYLKPIIAARPLGTRKPLNYPKPQSGTVKATASYPPIPVTLKPFNYRRPGNVAFPSYPKPSLYTTTTTTEAVIEITTELAVEAETDPTLEVTTALPTIEASADPSTEQPLADPNNAETPSTEVPSTEATNIELKNGGSIATEAPSTEDPITENVITEGPDTEGGIEGAPGTESPVTEVQSSDVQGTEASITDDSLESTTILPTLLLDVISGDTSTESPPIEVPATEVSSIADAIQSYEVSEAPANQEEAVYIYFPIHATA